MKVCTFNVNTKIGTYSRLGILIDEKTIIDANTVWNIHYEKEGRFNSKQRANHTLPSSLSKLLQVSDNPIALLNDTLGKYFDFQKLGLDSSNSGAKLKFTLKDEDIKLACPLDKITSYRDFYAHEKHVAKGFEKRNEPIPQEWYEIPAYYKGSTNGFIGPEDEILWPSYTQILDYELELGMIIGKEGKNISEAQAPNHIFGFTILNDISARDIQKKEMKIRLGPAKGKDFCSIMGPVIVTIDEFNHEEPDLLMTAKINGKEWSRGQSGESHFNFSQMIEHVSKDEWVLPGDFFGSGTVGNGCGLELDKWIKPGDQIELEVENIGKLINKVGSPIKN